MLASALAYSTFFAIPAVLLVVVGVFTLVVGPEHDLVAHGALLPRHAGVRRRACSAGASSGSTQHPTTGIAMTIVGFVLALWSTTGAMTTYMTAINLAYERKDGRTFVRSASSPSSWSR